MRKIVKAGEKLRTLASRFKIQSINIPARSSLFFTLTNLLCKGAAFLFTPLFTRLLSPAEYGEYSLFSTLLSLGSVAVTMEMSGGIIMRLFQKERERRFLSLLSAWLISVTIAVPTVALLFLIYKLGGFGMNFPLAYVFLFISLICVSMINLYVSRSKFLYKWVPPLITSLTQSVGAPLISIALIRISVFSSVNHVSLKIGAVTTVLTITAAALLLITLKEAKSELAAQSMSLGEARAFVFASSRFLLKLALPLLPYYLSITLISQADKIFISSALGKSELAKYSVAYSSGVALCALTSGVMSALSPWIMRRARANEYAEIRQTLDRIVSASVPAIIIFLCFAPEIFTFLAPKEYQSALPVLFISALIPIPLALAQCSSSIAIAREKVGGVLLSGIIPALFALSLNILTINRAPLYAPAIITALGFFILSAIGIANVHKITGNYTLNTNKVLQNLAFLVLSATAIYSFRNFLSIRIIISVIALLTLVSMAKPILSLLMERSKA